MGTTSSLSAVAMMDALLRLSRSLPGRSAEAIFPAALDALLAGAASSRGAAFEVAGDTLDLVAGRGLTPALEQRLRCLPLRDAWWFSAQRAAQRGKLIIDRVIAPAERALFAQARWEQTLACPVAVGGAVFGVVVIAWPDIEQPDERVLAAVEIGCHLTALEALRRGHPLARRSDAPAPRDLSPGDALPTTPLVPDAADDRTSAPPASLRQEELAALARAASDGLRHEGPKEGAAVIAMLRGRGVSEQEALSVLTFALSTGAVVRDPPMSTRLRAPAATEVRTVLVVDDDDDLRQTLSEILHEEGYAVETAPNGREALAALRQREAPRVVVLDLMMPVMDGWQLLHEIRRDAALSRIPVIVISASRNGPRAAGANEFLAKPLDYYKLVTSVERSAGGVALA